MKVFFVEMKDRQGTLYYEQLYIQDWQVRQSTNLQQLARTKSKSPVSFKPTGKILSKLGEVYEKGV